MRRTAKTVSGTFAWTQPDAAPAVGSYQAEWKFTPADGDTYAETTGTVTITVNKATPTGYAEVYGDYQGRTRPLRMQN